MATRTVEADQDEPFVELSAFQRDILAILAREGGEYGLAVKRDLEAIYGEGINHGRLYPNLDDLIVMGYVEKSELDKRTNEYALTEDGETALQSLSNWLQACLDGESNE